MTDINSLVIVGRLTRDCGSDPNGRDFTYTQGGMCIASFDCGKPLTETERTVGRCSELF